MMNTMIIIEKLISGKLAKLVLLKDNVTLKVVYEDKCLYTVGDYAYANLCSCNMCEHFLDAVVEGYVDKKKREEEFSAIVKELGW